MGECHYQVGNYDAIAMAHFSRRLLKMGGVNPERLALEWASAAEAPLFVALITKFTKSMKALGPLGVSEGISLEKLKSKLSMARALAANVKLRTRFAKLTHALREKTDYSFDLIEAEMSERLDEAIQREMEKQESIISA